MFDWFRFDPVPNVTAINPSGLNFLISASLEINATVLDNALVSTVLANVTLPNGTIQQLALTNKSGNNTLYNATFTVTNLPGTYTIRIIANDTSMHQNQNNTQTATFTVGDAIPPNVTNVTPIASSSFVLGTVINITANVTDNINVSVVLANITLPNSSIFQITLLNSSLVFFNGTFGTTDAIGTYTVRIIANDTSNMINSSETTTFTIGDVTTPNVTDVTPITGTNFQLNSLVNITANVTDNVGVSVVLANITLPNG